jgi:hypothetical protein
MLPCSLLLLLLQQQQPNPINTIYLATIQRSMLKLASSYNYGSHNLTPQAHTPQLAHHYLALKGIAA